MRLRGTVAMNESARRLRILFLSAPLLFMFVTLVLPAVRGVILSFDHDGPSLDNYRALFHDPMFWRALFNNLIVPLGSLVIEFVFGLAMALTLTSRSTRSPIIEVAAILPFAIPEIVILTLARYIFLPRGYLNGALHYLGSSSVPWLSPNHLIAMFTVMAVDAWHVTPVVMLMLMAGLQTIPAELYEAARLDGADSITTFRYVTLPMLTPAIIGAVVLRGVDALRIFATVLVLTGPEGVPVLSTYAFSLWGDAQQPNRAVAAAMILALMVTLLSIASMSLARRWSPQSGAVA
jgi:trehalose transport system permease protein